MVDRAWIWSFPRGTYSGTKATIVASRNVTTVDFKAEDVPEEAKGKYPMQAEWSGFLTPTETGDYSIGMSFRSGFARVLVGGKPVAQGWAGNDAAGQAKIGHIHLEQGKKVSLKVRYCTSECRTQ